MSDTLCDPAACVQVTHACTCIEHVFLLPGIRGFEFDTLSDPAGGKYAYAAGLKLAGATNTLISPDLLQPGIKVAPA